MAGVTALPEGHWRLIHVDQDSNREAALSDSEQLVPKAYKIMP